MYIVVHIESVLTINGEDMKKFMLTSLLVLVVYVVKAQVLLLTLTTLTSTPEGKMGRSIGGDWVFVSAEINGQDVLSDFEGIILSIPKCKKADRKAGQCPPVEVSGDENTDYFKGLFGDEGGYSITSRKAINKEAKDDAIYEKVMYEVITTENSEVEYAFRYKKKTMYIEAKSGDRTEVFEMIHPPKK
jgi:hypothetical protein